MSSKKLLVKCDDYNGYKDILFMMDKNDSRVDNGNYSTVCEGEYKGGFLNCENGLYRVNSDWSVNLIDSKGA